MPRNPSRAQRVDWHRKHAAQCGCRPIPPSIAAEIARAKRRA